MRSNTLRCLAAIAFTLSLPACGGGGGGGGPNLDLVAALSAPVSVLPSETFTYTVTLTAQGATAPSVGATLTLPAEVTVGTISGGGSVDNFVVTWAPVATVSPGTPLTYTVEVTAGSVGALDAVVQATTTGAESSTGNNVVQRRTVLGFEAIATLTGESAGDLFGFVADSVGDLDGDGRPDFAVGAPFSNAGGTDSGRAYVYSGATGTLLFAATGTAGQQLGFAVAAAGDVDGDGTGDVIFGAPGAGNGAARVYSGADGSLVLNLTGPSAGSRFGAIVAGAGDIDGNGDDDLLVGAQGAAAAVGQAFVISGTDGSTLRSHTGTSGTGFGHGIGSAGDVTGDGVPDYAIGGGFGVGGLVEVRSGADGTLLYTILPLPSGGLLGQFWIDSVGDVDGDTWPDLYVADINDSANRGRGYLVSGSTGAIIRTRAGEAVGDFFGIARHGGFDVDGDGVPDLFVAGYHNGEGGSQAGKAYVYSGATGAVLRTLTGTTANQTLGYDAVQLGDVDGDGLVDYLLTGGQEVLPGSGTLLIVKGTPLP